MHQNRFRVYLHCFKAERLSQRLELLNKLPPEKIQEFTEAFKKGFFFLCSFNPVYGLEPLEPLGPPCILNISLSKLLLSLLPTWFLSEKGNRSLPPQFSFVFGFLDVLCIFDFPSVL